MVEEARSSELAGRNIEASLQYWSRIRHARREEVRLLILFLSPAL